MRYYREFSMPQQRRELNRAWRELQYGLMNGSLLEEMRQLGSPWFDAEAFARSPLGKATYENFRLYLRHTYEMDPGVIEYWRHFGNGLEKKVHYPYQMNFKYATYVPLSAPQNPTRRYPLIILLHGGGNPIYLTETYGIIQEAARKEAIVVVPENLNEENILAIYSVMLAHYPVDPCRVYLMGYSLGAAVAEDFALLHPELLAGVCLGGQHLRYGQRIKISAAQENHLQRYPLAVININGTQEIGRPLPMNLPTPVQPPFLQRGLEQNIFGLNGWLLAAGCLSRVQRDTFIHATSGNEVEQALGLMCHHTFVRQQYGTQWFFADFHNALGLATLRLVGIDNAPHWPVGGFSECAWLFLHKFHRNPLSGELIYKER